MGDDSVAKRQGDVTKTMVKPWVRPSLAKENVQAEVLLTQKRNVLRNVLSELAFLASDGGKKRNISILLERLVTI